MAGVTRLLAGPLQRKVIVIGAIVLATVGVGHLASGQDRGEAVAKDAIFARKILMDTISTNMDELETMTASDKGVNLAEGHEHADNISIMLMAFPHLFAPS